jgi:phosphoglycolate phosphatase
MRYKLVIFDFDGTLADSFPWFLSSINQVADQFQFRRIEESDLDTIRGLEAGQIIKFLGVPLWKAPVIGKHMRALMARDISRIRLFEGVDRMLQELAEQGVVIALVSSNSSENIRQILGPANAGLIRYYQCGVTIFGKQAKLRKVLQISGIAPEEAIYIGDEIRDLQAAKTENIAFGAVAWGYTKPESLFAQGPQIVFTSMDEIARKLESIDVNHG